MSAELEKGLVTILSGTSPQTAAADRIYPRVPQAPTFPFIRYQRISTARNQALSGNVGVTNATMQIDCVAENYDDAKTLADAVRVLLHGRTGSWGTLVIRLVKLSTEHDDLQQDGNRVIHRVIQRYEIYTNMD